MTENLSLYALNPARHRDTRIIPGLDLEPRYLSHYTEIGLDEIGGAAADYPIFFMKDGTTGELRLVALFGFAPRQNVYVANGIWEANYLPIATATKPLSLAGTERVLCVDEANPRVTTDQGERLFDDAGNESPFLTQTRSLLERLQRGFVAAEGFVQALLGFELIQQIRIELSFDGGGKEEVRGLYSINSQRLDALAAPSFIELRERQFLAPVFALIQSLIQMGRMRQFHNASRERQILSMAMSMTA